MAGISDDHIASIVAKVAATLKISDWNYSQENFDTIGQNYFGEIIPVVLNGTDNGREVKFRLVLKLAPTDERYRVSGAVTRMFSTEIFVYCKLLEYFRQQNSKLPKFVIPACYYICEEYCKEVIAMQDMGEKEFKPYAQTFLNYDHMKISLISLARFHARSFILKKNNKNLYEEATKMCIPLTLKSNKRFMDVMEDRLNKAIEKFESTPYATVFAHLKQNQVKLIEAISNNAEETCICHGDIWKENILFRYEDSVPVEACLIDYQTARVSSPAYDVLYLIASSSDQELRSQYFHDMIELYYEEFDTTLEIADLEPQEEYSRSSFERDLKTVGPACLIVANTAIWLANGLQQEGHIKSKLVFNNKTEKVQAIENYKNIMKSLIDDFSSHKLLSFNTE